MTDEAYQKMVQALLDGDNTLLGHLQTYQAYCQKNLQIKSNQQCTSDQAYDIFIDAVMAFRTNIFKGERPDHRYLRAYLAKICWNMWMAQGRSRRRIADKQLEIKENLYEETAGPVTDHLSLKEVQQEEKEEEQRKVQLIQRAMKKLSAQCRAILHFFIVEGKSMNEIAGLLQLKNANVAKTTKSRCYNRLMKVIHDGQ